jgi:hypothetical protein
MLKIPRRSALVLGALALILVVALSAPALGAGSLAPQLRAPRAHHAVTVGHVRLVVYVPDPANVINGHIFLTISDKRIVRRGVLRTPRHCGFRCNIGIMKRIRHTRRMYAYVDPYHFPGNWQDTPGTYYWQAYYYPKGGVIGILPSRIKSFRIVR